MPCCAMHKRLGKAQAFGAVKGQAEQQGKHFL